MPAIPPRPPLRAGAPTRLANFRVTDTERAHIAAMAAAHGLTFSAYMRSLVPGLADVHKSTPTEEALPTT